MTEETAVRLKTECLSCIQARMITCGTPFRCSAQRHIQHHHQHKAQGKGDGAEVGVLAL